jgi:hypothetical protein
MKKIAVLWVFSGKLPSYWRLTLTTLLSGGSSRVDVHIICDDDINQYIKYIKNSHFENRVFFHRVNHADWKKRVQNKLNFTMNYKLEDHGRKIADFKPLWGDLFQDFIPTKEYGYWVLGDSDGWFGSYDNIIDYNVLPWYDVISGFAPKPENVQIIVGENRFWPLYCTGEWMLTVKAIHSRLL